MDEERDYYKEFRAELTALINKHCCEAESNTPDFILAQYLEDCLKAFDAAVEARSQWYGELIDPGDDGSGGIDA